WSHLLFRCAKNAGNRHSCSARCDTWRSAWPDHAARYEIGWSWPGLRAALCGNADPNDEEPADGRRRERSGDARNRGSGFASGGGPGVLYSGTTRDAGGPGGRAAIRLTETCKRRSEDQSLRSSRQHRRLTLVCIQLSGRRVSDRIAELISI